MSTYSESVLLPHSDYLAINAGNLPLNRAHHYDIQGHVDNLWEEHDKLEDRTEGNPEPSIVFKKMEFYKETIR